MKHDRSSYLDFGYFVSSNTPWFCILQFLYSSYLLILYNIVDRPEIIYFYPEMSAIVGDSIYLPCVAVGNPSANISWTYNGQPVANFPRYEVGHNGSLIIEKLKKEDQGLYTCTPFNKWLGRKRETRLSVLGTYYDTFILP